MVSIESYRPTIAHPTNPDSSRRPQYPHSSEWRPEREPSLPSELTDYIIDHLHDDAQTLRQCSLVCRAWLPSSSLHLFRSLSWPPCYHAWWGWNSRRCKCVTIYQASFLQGLYAFCVQSPRVQAYVRELKIACHWSIVDPDWGRTDYNVRISMRELLDVLDLLPSLQELDIDRLSFRREQEPLRGSRIRNLTKLTLSQPSPATAPVADINQIVDFLCLFDNISVLVLGPLWGGTLTDGTPLRSPPRRVRVGTIEVQRGTPLAVSQYLHLLRVTVNIEHLTALLVGGPWGSVSSSGAFQAFLRLATTLSSLTLHAPAPSFLLNVDSISFATLRKLTVINRGFNDGVVRILGTGVGHSWSATIEPLLHPRLYGVEELEIVFAIGLFYKPGTTHCRVEDVLEFIDWSLLESVVQSYKSVRLVLEVSIVSQLLSGNVDRRKVVEKVTKDCLSTRVHDVLQLVIR